MYCKIIIESSPQMQKLCSIGEHHIQKPTQLLPYLKNKKKTCSIFNEYNDKLKFTLEIEKDRQIRIRDLSETVVERKK